MHLLKALLLAKFNNEKNPLLKEETDITYKNYRNLISTLMKKSKLVYYKK